MTQMKLLRESDYSANNCGNNQYTPSRSGLVYNPVNKNFVCRDKVTGRFLKTYDWWSVNGQSLIAQKYNNQDIDNPSTEKAQAYNKCRKVFSTQHCGTIKYKNIKNGVVNFNITLKSGKVNGNNIFSVLGNSSRYNSRTKSQNETIEYYLRQKEQAIIPKCQNVFSEDYVLEALGKKYSAEQLKTVCSSNNLVLNSSSPEKRWVVLKTWKYNNSSTYPLQFDWNGKLLSPPKITAGEKLIWNGKTWDLQDRSTWDRFWNGVEGAEEIIKGSTKLALANNINEVEEALDLITKGKEKIDQDEEVVLAVIDNMETATDAWATGSMAFAAASSVETLGTGGLAGLISAAGTKGGMAAVKWYIKDTTLKNIKKFKGKYGFTIIKSKLEEKLLLLLKSGKITWGEVNGMFQNASGNLMRLFRLNPAYAGVGSSVSRKVSESVAKKEKNIFFSKIWSKVVKVNGRFPRNYDYAGKTFVFKGSTEWVKKNPTKAAALFKKYPNGVKFNSKGFPIFTPYSKKNVVIKMTGDRRRDNILADTEAKINEQYRKNNDLIWHHHEDGKTMQLAPADIHNAVKHTGGVAVIKIN